MQEVFPKADLDLYDLLRRFMLPEASPPHVTFEKGAEVHECKQMVTFTM